MTLNIQYALLQKRCVFQNRMKIDSYYHSLSAAKMLAND